MNYYGLVIYIALAALITAWLFDHNSTRRRRIIWGITITAAVILLLITILSCSPSRRYTRDSETREVDIYRHM